MHVNSANLYFYPCRNAAFNSVYFNYVYWYFLFSVYKKFLYSSSVVLLFFVTSLVQRFYRNLHCIFAELFSIIFKCWRALNFTRLFLTYNFSFLKGTTECIISIAWVLKFLACTTTTRSLWLWTCSEQRPSFKFIFCDNFLPFSE